MVKTVISWVKLVPEDGKYITDLDKTETFKHVTCPLEDIDKFIEITAEEAEVINQGIIGSVDA